MVVKTSEATDVTNTFAAFAVVIHSTWLLLPRMDIKAILVLVLKKTDDPFAGKPSTTAVI